MVHDLTEFCRLFYAMTYIPIVFYTPASEAAIRFPSMMQKFDLTPTSVSSVIHFQKNPDYCIMDDFSYLGYLGLSANKGYLIIGPVYSTPISARTIHDFMHEWAIPQDYRQDISQFLENIPQVSFYQFLHTLSYLSLCLNDIKINVHEHFFTSNHELTDITPLHSNRVFDSIENGNFHNTHYFEQEMLNCIQNGEVENLKQLLRQNTQEISAGTMADNSLRQEKNLFIVTATLATRSAVSGGLDIEQAYSLADTYIIECEKLQDIISISNLTEAALLDFTKRVAQNKIPGGMSREIFDCVQFIHRNTHNSIQVADVAAHVNRSRAYITAKFKKELGFDISSFIMRCKLEEAKSLLAYSDKSISEISSYLCFSSQGYFQNVFRKKLGMTPMQYKNKFHQ